MTTETNTLQWARRQGGYFTAAEAAKAGVNPEAIDTLLKSGHLVKDGNRYRVAKAKKRESENKQINIF